MSMFGTGFARRAACCATMAAFAAGTALAQDSPAETTETVLGLRQAGWTVVDKQERKERLPGVAPYENLVRVVVVTTYLMEKDGLSIRCSRSYDSQLDTFDEACAAAE